MISASIFSYTLCERFAKNAKTHVPVNNHDEEHTKTKMHDETLLNNGCDATEFRYGTLKIKTNNNENFITQSTHRTYVVEIDTANAGNVERGSSYAAIG